MEKRPKRKHNEDKSKKSQASQSSQEEEELSLTSNSQDSTPETRYSKPRYSKILDIVNKTQLPSWDFIEILCLDIVNDWI